MTATPDIFLSYNREDAAVAKRYADAFVREGLGQAASKQRPAVVISAARFNQARPDVIVKAVTSLLAGDARADDVPVAGWAAAGLLNPLVIKPVIATLETALGKAMSTILDHREDRAPAPSRTRGWAFRA